MGRDVVSVLSAVVARITVLYTSGVPTGEWIKAFYGGLLGVLKTEPSLFEVVGGRTVKLCEVRVMHV